MSWFSVEGELLDEATVNPSQMARLPNSRTPRAWQVADGLVLSATGRQRREAAAIVTTIRPVLVDPVRSSIEGVGPTMVASAPMDGGIYVQNPWKPFGVVTLRNGEMVVADTIDWRLSFHTPGTEVVRQLHAEVEQIPVNPELERQIDDTFEEYYGNNRTMVRLYEDMDPPDVLPAIGALRSSSDGQLLVTRFRPLEAGGPLVVDVLDPELRPSARLVLPAEYSQILDMIGDKVLVLTRGEFDVPVIRVLRVGAVSPER